jgi:hypothetical protein
LKLFCRQLSHAKAWNLNIFWRLLLRGDRLEAKASCRSPSQETEEREREREKEREREREIDREIERERER